MTIDRPPGARRWGMAALTVCHTPVRLMSIMSCQACSVSSAAVPKLTMPALAATMFEPAESGDPVVDCRLQRVVVQASSAAAQRLAGQSAVGGACVELDGPPAVPRDDRAVGAVGVAERLELPRCRHRDLPCESVALADPEVPDRPDV